MSTVRQAILSDVQLLIPIAKEFFLESHYPGTFQPESWSRTWQGLLEAGWGKILLVETNANLIGGLGFTLMPDHCTGDLTANELFLYVTKDQRGGWALLRLLRAYRAQVDELKVKTANLSRLVESDPRLGAIYESLGFKTMEISHQWVRHG